MCCTKAILPSRIDKASSRTLSSFTEGAMEGAAARALHQGSLTFQEDSTPGMKMSRNVCRSEPPLLAIQKCVGENRSFKTLSPFN